jgi:hypothetical protein
VGSTGRQIDPNLVRAATWPPLADAFAEADRAGHNLPSLLHDLVAHRPLDPDNPGADLQSRLLADLDPKPTPCPLPAQTGPTPRATFSLPSHRRCAPRRRSLQPRDPDRGSSPRL